MEILLGLYPAKVMLDPEDLDAVVTGFAGFVRFMAGGGLIPGAKADELATAINAMAGEFRIAALDEDNWSMGKRLWGQAQSEGIDIADNEAVQRFMDDFNQRPFHERDAILGWSPQGALASLGSMALGPLPPVVLSPIKELETAARATVTFQRLRRLVDYVGDGIPLTDTGNLKLADGKALVDLLETDDHFDGKIGDRVFKTRSTAQLPGVDLTFRIALAARMLVRERSKVLPGPKADLVDDPLGAVYGAWLGLLKVIGPTRYFAGDDTYGWYWYAEDLDESLPSILIDLYCKGTRPIEVIAAEMWRHLNNLYVLDDVPADKLRFHKDLVERSLRRAFDRLAELGTVQVSDVVETPTAYGGTDLAGGVVGLTPLGTWAVQRLASAVTSAPVVGAFRDASATNLLNAVSDIPEAEAEAEIEAWVDHHGDSSAGELVAALPDADETGRGLVFRVLTGMGPAAVEAVEALAGNPGLAPYLTVWRAETLDASPSDIGFSGDPEEFVRLLAAAIELSGPAKAVRDWAGSAAGPVGLGAMIDRVWRVELAETELVLATIGAEHPDRTIAKAARKALFKHRSTN